LCVDHLVHEVIDLASFLDGQTLGFLDRYFLDFVQVFDSEST
jgi:hypothetical protein